jgi:hypothetical protein
MPLFRSDDLNRGEKRLDLIPDVLVIFIWFGEIKGCG